MTILALITILCSIKSRKNILLFIGTKITFYKNVFITITIRINNKTGAQGEDNSRKTTEIKEEQSSYLIGLNHYFTMVSAHSTAFSRVSKISKGLLRKSLSTSAFDLALKSFETTAKPLRLLIFEVSK